DALDLKSCAILIVFFTNGIFCLKARGGMSKPTPFLSWLDHMRVYPQEFLFLSEFPSLYRLDIDRYSILKNPQPLRPIGSTSPVTSKAVLLTSRVPAASPTTPQSTPNYPRHNPPSER